MKKLLSFFVAFALVLSVFSAVLSASAAAETPACYFGIVNGQTYRNDYFDLRFEESDDWVFYDAIASAKEIPYTKETISTIADMYSQLSNVGVVYDLYATKIENSDASVVQVTVMDMKALFKISLDTDMLVDLLAEQIKQPMVDAYEVVDVTKGNIIFAGEERPSFTINASASGITLCEQVVLIRQEDYLAMIAAASTQESTVEELMARFHPTVDKETKAVLDEARLLINQGKGLEAMKLLLTASKLSDDPALETAIRRLENSQWKKVRQTVYDRTSGNVLYDYTYGYNDTGRLAETTYLSPDGELKSREVYQFDKNGFPCATTAYDADGNEKSRTVLTCDELGNLIRMEGSGTYFYYHNLYGDDTLIIRLNADGEEFNRTFYTFDEYGIWTGMVNLIDGRCVELPYDSEYEFLDGGDTLRITCRHSGTGEIAAEYELVFIPLS